MGLYLRKSYNFGPARLNLSKSGLGVSVGVKGARVSFGPRGTMLHAGRGGIYFRQSLNARPAQPQSMTSEPELVPVGARPAGSPQEDFVLAELRRCNSRMATAPLALVLGVLAIVALVVWVVPLDPLFWSFVGLAAALTVTAFVVLRRHDRRRLVLSIEYQLSDDAQGLYQGLVDALARCGRCDRLWATVARGSTADWKRNAGATELLRRSTATISPGMPRRLRSNVGLYRLAVPSGTLFFLPDRVLFTGAGEIHSFSYQDIDSEAGETRFAETGRVPVDACVVGHTWRYVNKDGTPDRRFAGNAQVPWCLYGELRLSTRTGLDARVQTSSPEAPPSVVAALQAMRLMEPTEVPDENPTDSQVTIAGVAGRQ